MTFSTGTADPLARVRGENFPIALAILPAGYRRDLRALYAFARLVDDIGDAPRPPGESARQVFAELDAVRVDLDRVFAGRPARIPALRPLRETVRQRGLPRAPFEALVEANRLDQSVTDYRTRSQLLHYCRLSANPVGRLVLGIFGVPLTPERRAASDAVCSALQIAEHLQDIAEDALRGRIYLPEEDRRRYDVAPADLRADVTSPSLRQLVLAEVDWAEGLLDEGSVLVGMLRGWPRLAVAGYLAGGSAALRNLRRRQADPLSGRTTRRHGGVARTGLRILVEGRLR
jgi:squalene synthase HpnC